MKVVFVANWWYRRGGLGAVMLDEARELDLRGHEVIPFASRHPENIETPWSRYFPEFRETADLGASMPPAQRVTTGLRLIRNTEAASSFAVLLREVRPNIIHLHNTVRQLSPAILGVARALRIPVVMTQHDYSMVCPQGQLYKGERSACTAPNCVSGNPLAAVVFRCIRRRLVPSAVVAAEYALHRSTRAYLRPVDLLLAPSHFVERSLLAGGIPASKVRYLANGVVEGPHPSPVPSAGGHILFAGRLAREKGLEVLLEAARTLPDVPMVIAGDGPLRGRLEHEAPGSIRFVGQQSPDDLGRLRMESIALVSPSTWYENAPIAVLEAMRDGRPVVVSSIGGQPELAEGGSGLVVRSGDAGALASAIRFLWNHRSAAARMGEASRQRLLERYTLDRHVSQLEDIYRDVIDHSDARRTRRTAS